MYDAVLLPTDGSVGMAGAIRHGFHLARAHDATVHALYVVDLRAYAMLPEETTQGQVKRLLADEGERAVEALADYAQQEGVELVSAIWEGIPHETILQYIGEHGIDLVVMGTHGRSGDSNRIVGSVAEEVVRSAAVPVVTVRMTDDDLEAVRDAIPEDAAGEIPDEQRRYIR